MNGVLIASKLPMTDVVCGFAGEEGQSRMIAVTIGGLRLVNLYCPQGQAVDSPKFPYKLRFFDSLIEWLGANCDPASPVLVTGDINIIPAPRDVWSVEAVEGAPSYHPAEHERWQALLGWGLADVACDHIPPQTYSFWDYRGGSFWRDRGMRIDHFLATEPVAALVEGAGVLRDWRRKRGEEKPSDHAPVALILRNLP